MVTRTLTRIDVLSAAKLGGVIYAGIGLLVGIGFALLALVMSAAGAQQFQHGNFAFLGAIMGVGAVVVFPIFYGVIGFVGWALMAAVFNLVARWLGGLRFEISE